MEKWKTLLSETDFDRLYSLLKKQDWLVEKDEAFKNLWMVCDCNDKKDLLIELLERFSFIKDKEQKSLEENLFNQVENVWKINLKESVFIPTSDGNTPDSSVWFIYSFRQHFFEYLNAHFYDRITKCWMCKPNNNLVLLEDFIGSGTTLIKKLTYLKSKRPKCHIFCMSLTGMEHGVKSIKSIFPDIDIYVAHTFKKGISDYYSNNCNKIQHKKSILKDITDKMLIKQRKSYLGYRKTEALYAYENYKNMSNNVFPIFWGENENGLKTLFVRKN